MIPGRSSPPARPGPLVAEELGGRKLLRYLTPAQIGMFRGGSTRSCYATPTPYSPEEAVAWLVLAAVDIPRQHALILDPAEIPLIQGPLWVAAGRGIQYILPAGFPASAIVVPGAPGMASEVEVR